MPKLIAILFLLPSIAMAECGFTQSGNAMTIVVGKNAKCLSSEAFREAFRNGIAQALEEGDAAARKRAYDDRTRRSAKLWAIAERNHQQSLMGGAYFGQR